MKKYQIAPMHIFKINGSCAWTILYLGVRVMEIAGSTHLFIQLRVHNIYIWDSMYILGYPSLLHCFYKSS